MQHDSKRGRHGGDALMWHFARRAAMALLLLVATGTQAQQVHTCIDAQGRRSLQDRPCAPPQRELAVRTFAPAAARAADADKDAPATRSTHPSRHARQSVAGEGAGARANREAMRPARSGGKYRTPRNAPAACETARAKRDATLDRVGLKRSYDLLQRLDASVQAACVRR